MTPPGHRAQDADPAETASAYTVTCVSRISEIGAEAWAHCAATTHPFVHYDFLQAMETSGVVGSNTGWQPQYLVLKTPTEHIKGVCPAYLKTHSMGEYVFDHGWADAYHRAGGQYYPKLQVSVPFTPVTGPRLLVPPHDPQAPQLRQFLAQGLQSMAAQHTISSVHVTFPAATDREALTATGFDLREDRQFHWQNHNFKDFDDFLATLNSRKRKDFRKERAQAIQAGISIHWLTGPQLTDDIWDAFYQFYLDTSERKWGQAYLNMAFFKTIARTMADKIVLIMAKRQDRWIAGALNLIDMDTLYGRYWGCLEYHPCLHFEVCYYQAIDYAIAHGLSAVEAGAQGGHKLARGYAPTATYSAHWFTHPGFRQAIQTYLEQERGMVAEDTAFLQARTPFKKDPNSQGA